MKKETYISFLKEKGYKVLKGEVAILQGMSFRIIDDKCKQLAGRCRGCFHLEIIDNSCFNCNHATYDEIKDSYDCHYYYSEMDDNCKMMVARD